LGSRALQRGFASFEAGVFIAWLIVYAWTGALIGERLGHPTIGMVAGGVVGFVFAAILGIQAHYGAWYALVGFVPVFAMPFIPHAFRLYFGAVACLVPIVAVAVTLIVGLVKGRGEEKRGKKRSE